MNVIIKNILGYLVYCCISTLILSSIISDSLPQTKDKTTKWSEPVFEHITVADGLPENSVNCITQDHLGYMWFGTQDGLVGYDGYNMKVYQPDADDSLSISDGMIAVIYEDKSGNLWIGTESGGLNFFDRKTETFIRYMNQPDDSASIPNNYVRCIGEDKNGNIMVGTPAGLGILNKQTKEFRRVNFETSVFTRELYEYILSLKAKNKTISSILQVGNNANLAKKFKLNKKTIVMIINMGEAGYDFGWLEDAKGKIITGPKKGKTENAGGYSSNTIRITIDTLQSGEYNLNYTSDGDWSYNSWQIINTLDDNPPDHPEFWGIQVIELGEDHNKLSDLLSTEKRLIQHYKVGDILEDRLTGKIYVSIENKILVYDTERELLLKNDTILGSENELGVIQSFYQAADGTIWIGHLKGLARFNSIKNTIKSYLPVPSREYSIENHIGDITEDNYGFIWGNRYSDATLDGNGLFCFDPHQEIFREYNYDPENGKSLSSDWVRSLFKDRSGIIWVGTGMYGLNKWDSKEQKFTRYRYDSESPEAKLFGLIYSMAEDQKGNIWLGTQSNGLYNFNPVSQKFRNFWHESKNYIRYIYVENSETIWLGTTTRGLGKFDQVKGQIHFYSNDSYDTTTISHNNIHCFLPDGEDILWIGTFGGGLNKFYKDTGKFLHYRHNIKNPQSISSDLIVNMYKDKSGIIWIGTHGGLNKFNPTNGIFKSYQFTKGMGGSYVIILYEDKKGNLWVGTFGDGIHLFDREKEISVYNLKEKDGLANNQVYSILEDDTGNLWIGTNNGLSKFNPQTRSIKNFFFSGGVAQNRFGHRTVKTPSGEMLFSTRDGFIMFHPDSIKDDPYIPQVVISSISLFNRPEEKLKYDGFISDIEKINLPYNHNDLRFDYVGLHYGEPNKNRYKYMLENFDEDWIDAGTQRNATYTNLSPGEYTFRVIACNRDGVWNEEGASLKITISPPFWATWWAYTFYVIFFGLVLYGIRRYEMNRIKLKDKIKLDEAVLKEREETDKMKSRFFANISHEFRTPLTLILGPSENILTEDANDNVKKQAGAIKRNASRLLNLVNQLLDLSKLEAGKLQLQASKENIVSFVRGVTMSFESLAERKDIKLKVTAEKNDIELYFDRDKMAKILANLLSNAFKFTGKGGEITVALSLIPFPSGRGMSKGQGEGEVQIKVSDTGVGISEEELPKLFDRFYQVDSSQTREHEGTGIGLALTKELVELHHGKIKVTSKVGAGSEFIVELPIGRKHLRDDEIIDEVETKDTVILSEVVPENLTTVSSRQKDGQASNTSQNDSDSEDKTIILVVEDNAEVREYIKDSLGNDFTIEMASNGEQGVNKACEIIPDLIISDIMMPKMDGNELARRIKNDERTSHIPVILLTAKSEQESKLEGLETGADDYLTKPFDTRELQIRINNLINIRRKLQEKYSKGVFIPVKRVEENLSQPVESKTGKMSSLDERFMSKVMEVIEKHISEEEFSIEEFGKELGMSRMQVHRKLKALSGKSASNYLRSARLNKAKKMIEEQKGNISEIAYSVGFSSPQYFTRCFKEEFGFTPSELLN